MNHASFIEYEPTESDWYKKQYLEEFKKVREVTPGNHGCKLVEIISAVSLVINSAVAYNQCPTYSGFYRPGTADIQVLPIDLFDDPKVGEPHSRAGNAKQYFSLVNANIRQTIQSGKSVVLHCMASLSRSVCFVVAYLVEERNLSVAEACEFIKEKWDATWPNHSFVFQLIEFEHELAELKGRNKVPL